MQEESEGGRWHEILCDVRQRGGWCWKEEEREAKFFIASSPACVAPKRGSELVEEGEIAQMCASFWIRGALEKIEWRVVRCLYHIFCPFGALRTLIRCSMSTRIDFAALILPMCWAQSAPNMEAVLFISKFRRL